LSAGRADKIAQAFLGSIRHSCKKLQASVRTCPEITKSAVFVHIINPTGFFVYDFGDLSRKGESSEQFVWYGERETQLRRWAMMPSIQADWSQDEVI
jgi:hypothetical protein